MTRITVDLIRKKAEHNEGILENLEEISLHQLHLERIEVIASCCKHLKILYLQNNLIPKIENLKRLKELVYLNLALNNIKKIEGLQSCESLGKLDLTVNFIGVDTFEESILNLRKCVHLKSLFLSGNPCCDFEGYRKFVIATLPSLKKLDGKEITKSERIVARQELKDVRKELRKKSGVTPEPEGDDDDDDSDNEAFTAENRLKWHLEELQEEKEKEEARQKAMSIKQPPDPLKEARKKMSKKVTFVPEGKLPAQRNMPRVKFSFDEDDEGNLIAIIEAPKFLDTSMIEVDVHPRWFQCIIKDKNLLLHTPEEIHPDKTRLKRLLHNGHLHIIMPKVHWRKGKVLGKKGDENLPKNMNSTKQAREEELQRREKLAVDYRNIISNNKKAKEKAEEARMVTGNIGFLTHKRAYELEETSKTASAADAKEDGNESSDCDEDDSEVPPLM